MKEIILHLGIPKTGSTALQAFLARNYGALLTRSVDYFRMGEFELGLKGRIAAGNGVHVACSLLPESHARRIANGERYLAELDRLIDVSPAERGVLSSEMFANAERRQLRAFLERLHGRDIAVRGIYYIRRQDQLLSSSYVQQVRLHGYTEPPEDYVRTLAANNGFLRYHSLYRSMVDLFGAANLVCRSYDDAVRQKNGVFADFLAAAAIDDAGLSFDIPKVNTSVSAREVAMLLLLNRFRPRKQFIDMVVENADKNAKGSSRHNLLSRPLIAEIEALFREENTKLAEEYFKRPVLFDPAPIEGPEDPLASTTLTIEDLVIFLGGLLVRFDGRLSEVGRLARAVAGDAGAPLNWPRRGSGQEEADEGAQKASAEL
jgi:hypothetical protein